MKTTLEEDARYITKPKWAEGDVAPEGGQKEVGELLETFLEYEFDNGEALMLVA